MIKALISSYAKGDESMGALTIYLRIPCNPTKSRMVVNLRPSTMIPIHESWIRGSQPHWSRNTHLNEM
jgi:hypothetical protein